MNHVRFYATTAGQHRPLMTLTLTELARRQTQKNIALHQIQKNGTRGTDHRVYVGSLAGFTGAL